ncbi:MAG: Flp pilus assembly protein CpaB [Desulfurivibrionaceae bacterium]
MRKMHPALILCVAILFGVLAVFLANRWLSGQTGSSREVKQDTVPLTEIVIASQDIDVGARLTRENLTMTQWPKANVPRGAFKKVEEVEDRVAVTRLVAGQPLLKAELAEPGSGAGLAALIPQGYRAMSIKVNEVIGVSGFVQPNSYVDVIGMQKENNRKTAKTILKKIKVLAIAQETYNEEGKAKVVRTVTLQIKPEESEKLALQTHEGSIHLVMRNPLDKEVDEPEVKVAKAEPEPERKSVPVLRSRIYSPKPSPHAVEILRASKREEIKFKESQSEERF